MTSLSTLATATTVGNPKLNIGIFLAFVVFTLAIVIRVASGKKTAEQYYCRRRHSSALPAPSP